MEHEHCVCELDQLANAKDDEISAALSRGSDAHMQIQDLQRLLFETGYGGRPQKFRRESVLF